MLRITLIGKRKLLTCLPFFFGFLLFASHFSFSQSEIEGVWKSEDGRYMMKIASLGDEFQGRIVWMKDETDENGGPVLDAKNPDEKLRRLPVKGSRILRDMKHNPSGKNWEQGTIYLPETGKQYECFAKVAGQKLSIVYKDQSGAQKSWSWTREN